MARIKSGPERSPNMLAAILRARWLIQSWGTDHKCKMIFTHLLPIGLMSLLPTDDLFMVRGRVRGAVVGEDRHTILRQKIFPYEKVLQLSKAVTVRGTVKDVEKNVYLKRPQVFRITVLDPNGQIVRGMKAVGDAGDDSRVQEP